MLTKNVDGKIVQLSSDEEAQVRSAWAAADASQADYEAKKSYLDKRIKELEGMK